MRGPAAGGGRTELWGACAGMSDRDGRAGEGTASQSRWHLIKVLGR